VDIFISLKLNLRSKYKKLDLVTKTERSMPVNGLIVFYFLRMLLF